MSSNHSTNQASPAGRVSAWVVGLAAGGAAAWYAWMGWDHTYQIDPATGLASGPYQAWQVVGCGLTLLALAAAAECWARPRLLVLVLVPAFTVAWSIDSAAADETGLWAVGALGILIGMLSAVGILHAAVTAVWYRNARAQES